jgi:NAD(P)-dependent dehydrogenase (short-subunit alcohol dehydrogenase family)
LVEEGATVVAVDRDLIRVQEAIGRHGSHVCVVKSTFWSIVSEAQPRETGEEIWDGQIELNLKSVFLARKCALSQMISRRSVTSAVGPKTHDDKLDAPKLCAKQAPTGR